jgi:hypothetical protein
MPSNNTIVDGVSATVNLPESQGISTVAQHETDARVEAGPRDRIRVVFPGFSLGNQYDELRFLIGPEQAQALGHALIEASEE